MIRQELSGAITNSIIHHVMGIPFVDAQGMGLYGMKWQPPASLRAQRPLKDVRDEYKPQCAPPAQCKVDWTKAYVVENIEDDITVPTIEMHGAAFGKSRVVNYIHTSGDANAIPDDGRRYKVLEGAEAERVLKAVDQLAKPKRIRSRHKPLTEDDIVVGCSYVPKKGNQFSPKLKVIGIGPCGQVHYTVNTAKLDTPTKARFLTLVSRKA
ncbi:hypothetical protein XccvBFoX4_gp59c [Xanthomonas phage FoX4]|uniref:Uncharacterized protein n=1 Tax=Xanthomonas phage FoX4 TaxID=2723900 RepID=A0A858WMN9_9CAUD|nr:hypothetical protein KNU97_gp59 [Xanthomonas phage FoX4]QJI53013.1 hypothetical protein XccvBFoX4_gp59c [Xanthomonas phage FoX4]